MGKLKVCVSQSLTFLAPRLYFQFNFSGSRGWTVKLYVALFSPQVSALIWAKGFIKFKQVVFAHTLDNQRVWISVFSVSSYILVLRYKELNWLSSLLTGFIFGRFSAYSDGDTLTVFFFKFIWIFPKNPEVLRNILNSLSQYSLGFEDKVCFELALMQNVTNF